MKNLLKNKRYLVGVALLLIVAMAAACRSAPAANVDGVITPVEDTPVIGKFAETGSQSVNTSWQQPRPPQQTQTQAIPPTAEMAPPQSAAITEAQGIVEAFETVIGSVHAQVLPSVANIVVVDRLETGSNLPPWLAPPSPNERQRPEDDFFFRNGQGSGFVWDSEGHIITNEHVVADAHSIKVVFSDGREADAEVIGKDADSDIAVLKVDIDADLLNPVTLGDSSAVKVGQIAIAIGNPFGHEFTTTTGIVSAIGRTIRGGTLYSVPNVIQTDAPINPGNSGGPLLDRQGRVIGINAQIATRTGSNSGVGFAIPINTAKQVVPALIDGGSFKYSWLGIRGTTLKPIVAELMGIDAATSGAQVIAVAQDGPAEKAGIVGSDKSDRTDDGVIPYGGDVIVAIDGTAINSMDSLIIYLLENTQPRDVVTMSVVRDGGEMVNLEVTLGERPEP